MGIKGILVLFISMILSTQLFGSQSLKIDDLNSSFYASITNIPEIISFNVSSLNSLNEDKITDPSAYKEDSSNLIVVVHSLAGLIFVIIGISLWRIFRMKQKNNELLKERNNEILNKNKLISEQKEELLTQAEELIRHQQHLEEIVKERTIELMQAKEKAEESDKLKTEFFNNLSHEIRTPLNAIVGFINILTTYQVTEEEKDLYAGIVQESSDKLLQILNDVIEISELNTKQCKIFNNEVNLKTVFFNLKNKYSEKARVKNLKLSLSKNLPEDEMIILTDKYRLKRILGRLIENAIKFTDTGFVEIGYRWIDKEIELYVKDTGIGIDKEKKEKIFESFSQENIQISRDFGGLGIGLAIAKENVKLLGGRIGFDSEKGKGTTFYFYLPLRLYVGQKTELSFEDH